MVKTKEMTQHEMILDHLRSTDPDTGKRRGLSQLEAKALYGIDRLASRIDELKNHKGYDLIGIIKTDNTGKRYTRYYLRSLDLQPTAKKDATITLKLTPRQAESLEIVACCVGGNPAGRRGDIDAIGEMLRTAGVPSGLGSEDSLLGPAYTEVEGDIIFKV
jgi:hypothetical protein